MTDVLRIAHPQDCPLEGNPEVGNPEGNQNKRKIFTAERKQNYSFVSFLSALAALYLLLVSQKVNECHFGHKEWL